jgi:hypothetical protein
MHLDLLAQVVLVHQTKEDVSAGYYECHDCEPTMFIFAIFEEYSCRRESVRASG